MCNAFMSWLPKMVCYTSCNILKVNEKIRQWGAKETEKCLFFMSLLSSSDQLISTSKKLRFNYHGKIIMESQKNDITE